MPANHTILELRTGRDSEHTPESAVQLFSSLPNLKNQIWWKILRQNESLSVEVLVENQPTAMVRVGVNDSFGESGKPDELYQKYGLTKENIIKKVKDVLRRAK